MSNLVEALVAKTFKEFEILTRKPEERLRINADIKAAEKLKVSAKTIYDFVHLYDPSYRCPFVPELVIEDFDDEQIWQELELKNEATTKGLVEILATTNLEQAKLSFEITSQSNSASAQSLSKKAALLKRKPDESVPTDSDEHREEDSVKSDVDSDEEIQRIKRKFAKSNKSDGLLLSNSDVSEEEELFLDAENEMEEGDDEAEEDELDFDFELSKGEPVTKLKFLGADKQNHKSNQKTTPSIVDDQFFKLAEMEKFLQQEDDKEEKLQRKATKLLTKEDEDTSGSEEDLEDDLDMFADMPDDEKEEGAMYADFFDPPEDVKPKKTSKTEKISKQESKEDSDDKISLKKTDLEESEDDEKMALAESGDEEESMAEEKKVRFSKNASESDSSEDSFVASKKVRNDVDTLSTFEKRQERLQKQIADMEEASLQPKPWQLSGEVASRLRPENSLLEEHLNFEHTTRTAPEITEETTQKLEDIIKQRIKDKAWDDVVRKERAREEPYEFKKRVQLDQEKSKMSLSQVYEQEYLKQQAQEEEEKVNPQHEAIKKMMQSLFNKLDALSNFHYTPKQAVAEVKIISNMPSITMEEVAPISVSEASLLAPEEVQAKSKRELKGKEERTETDKKRERRLKKIAKREREKEKEKRRKAVEKINPGLGNKYSKERALRDLEKQSKTSNNVQLIKDKKEKISSSSKNFFTQLQEEVTSEIKSKAAKAKKKEENKKSSKSYLL